MATSIRQQKVNSQIQKIVATVLLRDVADPRVDGLVSVTRVEVTKDLREAKVFLSVLGGHKTPATVLDGIQSAGRHIQGEVASELNLRFAPRLSYHLDDSLKKQAEMLKLIGDVVGNKKSSSGDAPSSPDDEAAP